jgi:hypothetical protein
MNTKHFKHVHIPVTLTTYFNNSIVIVNYCKLCQKELGRQIIHSHKQTLDERVYHMPALVK